MVCFTAHIDVVFSWRVSQVLQKIHAIGVQICVPLAIIGCCLGEWQLRGLGLQTFLGGECVARQQVCHNMSGHSCCGIAHQGGTAAGHYFCTRKMQSSVLVVMDCTCMESMHEHTTALATISPCSAARQLRLAAMDFHTYACRECSDMNVHGHACQVAVCP